MANSPDNSFTWQVPLGFSKLFFASFYRITRPRMLMTVLVVISAINALIAVNDYQTYGDWSPLAYGVSLILTLFGAYAVAAILLAFTSLKHSRFLKGQVQSYSLTRSDLTIKAGGIATAFDRQIVTQLTLKRWGYAAKLKMGATIILYMSPDQRKTTAAELSKLGWS